MGSRFARKECVNAKLSQIFNKPIMIINELASADKQNASILPF